MKIAWISYDHFEYSALHINAMNKEHQVLAVLPKPEDDHGEEIHLDDDVLRFLFENPRLRQPLKQYRSICSILNALTQFKPDVVHLQQGHLWLNFSLDKIRQLCPLVITVHDPRPHSGDKMTKKTPQWVIDYGFRQADHLIVHGKKLVDTVCQISGVSSNRVHVIPHVAMGNMTNQGNIDHRLTDPNTILFFGRIWDYKGLKYLIEAEPIISASCPDVKIIIAGQGDDFGKYRRLIKNSDRYIIDNDWITDQKRSDYFSQAGVVVLPYTDATQSGVVPVAYNFGKPVIASDVGALSDCVFNGKTGLLVPPKNPQELAHAIIRLLKDPLLARRMGHEGRNWVEGECSPKAVAKKHVEAYKKTVIYRACKLGLAFDVPPQIADSQTHLTKN